jgi:hypothetical protein
MNMDNQAIELIKDYIARTFGVKNYNIFIVWKCKTIQNWKYLIGTSVGNNYYEVTYNGDKCEWYLDVYAKIDKKVIKQLVATGATETDKIRIEEV